MGHGFRHGIERVVLVGGKLINRRVSEVDLRYFWLYRSVLLVFAGCMVAGCGPSESERFIQGTWAFANEQGDPRATELHVLQEWWFGGGRFFFQQEIAFGFPMVAEGRYRIVERSENRLILELYFVEGNAPVYENQQIIIVLAHDIDSIRINRTLYYRVGP